ncbi:ORF6C domain-containing protein [Clostridium perfringens]|uniref:ORF6C domain-containing protein n=1 Tax=Clostridium perfringens TaxID=1502 RepID=UPI00096A5F8C|nr:ORF6C domain-containing protein [Clostridium perfringens]
MNNLMIFENKELGIDVRTIKNDDGSICINAEDSARGFGWVQVQNKNGKEYKSIRWERMNSFCKDLGFPPQVGEGDYIPESLFYLLGMKANNEVARKFQTWLAVEVIPAIRKTGQYQLEKKPTSAIDLFESQLLALKEVKGEVQEVRSELEEFKEDLPLIGAEPEELQAVVQSAGTRALGGYECPAYKDKKLRARVFQSVWKYVKDQFNVRKYKAIKRKHLSKAKEIAENYTAPFYLQEEIDMLNNQGQLNI